MGETSKMADIYAGGVFDMAATHARNSDEGLFPTQANISPLAMRTVIGEVKVVLWDDPKERFTEAVIYSMLLSRGWVYQKVLFTPANVFYTPDEMWWSCSDATYSGMFSAGILVEYNDGRPVHFIDDLRHRKHAMMPGNI